MSDTCGNPSCSASRCPYKGKLFCAEIEISSASEIQQRKTAYVWLCDYCALQMKPNSLIAAEVIRALVAQASGAGSVAAPWVN